MTRRTEEAYIVFGLRNGKLQMAGAVATSHDGACQTVACDHGCGDYCAVRVEDMHSMLHDISQQAANVLARN